MAASAVGLEEISPVPTGSKYSFRLSLFAIAGLMLHIKQRSLMSVSDDK